MGKLLDFAGLPFQRLLPRHEIAIEDVQNLLSHHHQQFRLGDAKLFEQVAWTVRFGLRFVHRCALDQIGTVNDQWVQTEFLNALDNRVT